jgi:hypothetical protein
MESMQTFIRKLNMHSLKAARPEQQRPHVSLSIVHSAAMDTLHSPAAPSHLLLLLSPHPQAPARQAKAEQRQGGSQPRISKDSAHYLACLETR